MNNIETYDDKVVRLFLFASAVWGIIGMLVLTRWWEFWTS